MSEHRLSVITCWCCWCKA